MISFIYKSLCPAALCLAPALHDRVEWVQHGRVEQHVHAVHGTVQDSQGRQQHYRAEGRTGSPLLTQSDSKLPRVETLQSGKHNNYHHRHLCLIPVFVDPKQYQDAEMQKTADVADIHDIHVSVLFLHVGANCWPMQVIRNRNRTVI